MMTQSDCDHIYDEHGRCFECDKPRMTLMHKNQVEIDRRYRQRMAQQGIVRKTVLVPESRWKELQAMLRKWREEALLEGEKDE